MYQLRHGAGVKKNIATQFLRKIYKNVKKRTISIWHHHHIKNVRLRFFIPLNRKKNPPKRTKIISQVIYCCFFIFSQTKKKTKKRPKNVSQKIYCCFHHNNMKKCSKYYKLLINYKLIVFFYSQTQITLSL